MKQRNLIWLALLILFLIETTIIHWIIPLEWQAQITIAPHFVLTVIVFVGLYSDRYFALVLGLVFGLLHDILFYGYMIGPYSFAMGMTGYLTGLIFRRSNAGFTFGIFVTVLANFYFEIIIYGLYRLFRVIDVPLGWAFMHHILPSLLFNLLLALMIYIPIRYLIERMGNHRETEEN